MEQVQQRRAQWSPRSRAATWRAPVASADDPVVRSSISLLESELNELRARADRAGVSTSMFIRKSVFGRRGKHSASVEHGDAVEFRTLCVELLQCLRAMETDVRAMRERESVNDRELEKIATLLEGVITKVDGLYETLGQFL